MIYGDPPWRAGKSLGQWSRDLKREINLIRLCKGWLLIPPALHAGVWFSPYKSVFALAGATVASVVFVNFICRAKAQLIKQNKQHIKNNKLGIKGEKHSAWLWLRRWALSPSKVFVMHDRSIPKKWIPKQRQDNGALIKPEYTNANLDHLVINHAGVFQTDSKFMPRQWTMFGTRIHYKGGETKTSSTSFETECVQKALDKKFGKDQIPLHTVWVIWGGSFQKCVSGGFWQQDDVTFLAARGFPKFVKSQPKILSPKLQREVAEYLGKEFPRYSQR